MYLNATGSSCLVLWLSGQRRRTTTDVIQQLEMDFHLYADDTQLYITFNPKVQTSIHNAKSTIAKCTLAISAWMKASFLKLNGDKTEVLVITPPSVTSSIIPSVDICGASIMCSDCVRNLGVLFDDKLNYHQHIKSVCAKAYYQLHLIGRVRRYINEDATRALVQANVTSRLDYCNSLLLGLPDTLINQLQRVQKSAARLNKGAKRRDHVTPLLEELHWLLIRFRVIRFKLILLIFKCLNDESAPPYLSDIIYFHNIVPTRNLRSQNQHLLTPSKYRLKHYGARCFTYLAPCYWNVLPLSPRSCNSLVIFKKQLKTQ